MGGASPEQAVIVGARQAGELAADHFKDLRRAQARNQQPQQARRRDRGGRGADVCAGAGAAFDEALSLQVEQRPRDSGSRDAERLDQLGFAGQAVVRAVTSGGDVGAQLAGYFPMFGFLGHALQLPKLS
jgi:hypothetical protein